MALTFISTIILAIIQTAFCGFSFWIILNYIAVFLFCLRLVGATFRVKVLIILQSVSLGLWLLWTFMFGGWEHWPKMIIYLVISAISSIIMIYEDALYLIVEKDIRSTDYDDDDTYT